MTKIEYSQWPAGVPKSLPVASHTLDDNLRAVTKVTPDKTALIFYGATKSYAQLNDEVTRVAAYLQSVCGIQKGDRVGSYMQNSVQFVAAFYGIIRAGGIVVPINPMHKKDELTYLCQDAAIRTVLTAQDIVANAASLLETGVLDHVIAAHYGSELPNGNSVDVPDIVTSGPTQYPEDVIGWSVMMTADVTFVPVKLSPEDCCILPYTSGSTGRGKGCKHTHQTALHGVGCIQEWFAYTGDEVHLGATPMFHIVGMQGVMNVAIATGATIAIMSRWDRNAAAAIIAQNRVSDWATVPTAVIDLLNTEGLVAEDLASMRLIYGGGSAMPEAVAKRLDDLTGLKFVEVYGMTETMGPVTHNPMDAPKAGCVGIPVMNTKLRLLDPETLVPVPVGEVGEVVISGPQVMQGYWENSSADAEALITIDGAQYLRTGDLAYADADGNIHIVDRLKRMINASGYKVWPAEVEARLYQHPAIAEACIISTKDDYRGEAVKAVVVLRQGADLDAQELTTWAKDHMAAYKVPRLLDVVESLPKSAAGKVLWRQLQDEEDARAKETP